MVKLGHFSLLIMLSDIIATPLRLACLSYNHGDANVYVRTQNDFLVFKKAHHTGTNCEFYSHSRQQLVVINEKSKTWTSLSAFLEFQDSTGQLAPFFIDTYPNGAVDHAQIHQQPRFQFTE